MKADIWREGKYLDLWSVVHFLSGIVFTGWILMFGFNFLVVFILYIILAIGWEIFEAIKKVREHTINRILDVVYGVVGFFLVYALDIFDLPMGFYGLLIATSVYLSMEIHGYLTYKKRSS